MEIRPWSRGVVFFPLPLLQKERIVWSDFGRSKHQIVVWYHSARFLLQSTTKLGHTLNLCIIPSLCVVVAIDLLLVGLFVVLSYVLW